MAESPLTGGNLTPDVVRIGATVHRTKSAAFTVSVLSYLEFTGYPHAPRHLGVDDQGRDMLTFIPGHTTDHPSQRSAGAYAIGGRMLRALHDATAGRELAEDFRWARVLRPAEGLYEELGQESWVPDGEAR